MARHEPYTPEYKARNKRAYQKKLKEQRCVNCGKQDERTLEGHSYCRECRDKHKATASPRKPLTNEQKAQALEDKRSWLARCTELQICAQCGEKDKHTVNGHRYCALCQGKINKKNREKWDHDAKSEYHKNRRDQWREQGRCTRCGGKREEPDRMMCIDCRVKARMQRIKRMILKGERPYGQGNNP